MVMDPEVIRANNNYPFKTGEEYVWFIAIEDKEVVGFVPVEQKSRKKAVINNYYVKVHRQQQFLFGIPLRLRVQPLRKKLMHKIPPIPAPIYAGMGRKEIEPWTYRSAISSS